MTLNSNLKIHRSAKDFTQQELADKVNVSRQTIISIEKGEYSPSITLALKIAAALEVDVNELFYLLNE